jgi:hypothetical protein
MFRGMRTSVVNFVKVLSVSRAPVIYSYLIFYFYSNTAVVELVVKPLLRAKWKRPPEYSFHYDITFVRRFKVCTCTQTAIRCLTIILPLITLYVHFATFSDITGLLFPLREHFCVIRSPRYRCSLYLYPKVNYGQPTSLKYTSAFAMVKVFPI